MKYLYLILLSVLQVSNRNKDGTLIHRFLPQNNKFLRRKKNYKQRTAINGYSQALSQEVLVFYFNIF